MNRGITITNYLVNGNPEGISNSVGVVRLLFIIL